MTTALQIITDALTALGVAEVGQTLESADAERARGRLNDMLESWALDSFFVYTTSEAVYTIPSPASSLTIGPGQTINVARPVSILSGGYIRSSGQDYPLTPIDRATYAAIENKTLSGGPGGFVHYDGNGTLKLYPAQAGELHLPLNAQLTAFASLNEDHTLPQGYKRAISLLLEEELADDYGRDISPRRQRLINAARRSIKRSNHSVPILKTFGERRFNILTGA